MPLLEIVPPLLAAADIREPLVPLWAMELAADVFLGAWLFFVGASVGSFLNVVVYRLPRALNLVYPASRCPNCLHPIRLRDNVPVLSWLLLGGKCRDCRAPVSSRYFWIELLMGSVFLGVWFVNANLARDFGSANLRFGLRAMPAPSTIPFWCAYVLHVGLIATLVAGALVHADGFRTPFSLFAPILILGLVLPLVWPELRRVAAFPYRQPGHWEVGLIDGAAGAIAGALLALCGSLRWLILRRGWPRFSPVALLASVGAVLGWQLMLLVTPAIVILYLLAASVLWLLGPLPSLPTKPLPATNSSASPELDTALNGNHDQPPATAEPPLPAIPANRDLSP